MRTEKEIKAEIIKLVNSKGNGTTYGGRLAKSRKINTLLWVLGIDTKPFQYLEKGRAIFKWEEQETLDKIKEMIA